LILIYRIEKGNRRVILYRTGSHSDLFWQAGTCHGRSSRHGGVNQRGLV